MDAPSLARGGPDIPRPRRVMTAPVSASTPLHRSKSSSRAASKAEDLVETLYNHPSVRIISFTSSQRGFTTSSDNDAPPGSLPPSSRLERTIAVGHFRIYRAPGSVAFLSCGSALQPILPKSQCWCINEDNSRFVLQIRRPQYWRIEVPVADPDDAHRAVLLRDVFDKILLFEKTECPFERSFTVRLPDPPETPIKKKAWTAEGKNLISSPFESDLSPPAHAPMIIRREKRATSIPRETILPSTESISGDEGHGNSRPEGSDRSFGNIIQDPKEHERVDASAGTELPSYCSLPSEDDHHPVGGLDETAANVPIPSENITQDSPVAPAPTSPAVSTEALQDPRVQPSGSSLSGKEILHEETHADLSQTSRLGLQDIRSAVKDDHVFHEPRNLHCSVGSKGNACASVSQTEDKREAETCRAPQTTQKSMTVPDDDTTANSSEPMVSTTSKERSSPTQKGDDLEPNHLSHEDDPASFEGSGRVAPVNLARKRMTRMLAGRSFTAPPQLTLVASPPSKSKEQLPVRKTSPLKLPQPSTAEAQSPSASTDSFHSVESWHSPTVPFLPSPPSSRPVSPHPGDFSPPAESVAVPESLPHATCPSDHTATPKKTINVIPNSTVVSDSCDSAETTPRPTRAVMNQNPEEQVGSESEPRGSRLSTSGERLLVRRRSHASNLSISRRALSPLPPAANLFTPPPRQTSQSRLAVVRRLPAAIVHKTVEILLSPPGHLVNLMLKVAAKIAAGEWRGLVFGFGEAGEQIPVQWDYYSDGEFSSLSGDEDDYTLANHGSNRSDSVPRTDTRRRSRWTHVDNHDSWEVD
ncbi:inheritance of peroxisomes protein 1-domain-containing protein [Xylariaceae sp. AK1471]|nr:inheritance of peroxisomes protein 1-domain-containing protein [Xylariaceae sp. AK1471]